MKQEQIDYSEFEALGAKRGDMDCPTHFNQYGYNDFWLRLKIIQNIYSEWDNKTRTCELYQVDNKDDQNIISRFPIESLERLKQIIKFLNPVKFKDV